MVVEPTASMMYAFCNREKTIVRPSGAQLKYGNVSTSGMGKINSLGATLHVPDVSRRAALPSTGASHKCTGVGAAVDK
jgi:hypothetical protein